MQQQQQHAQACGVQLSACTLSRTHPLPPSTSLPHFSVQPGSKGIALQAPAWATLVAQMPALSAGLDARDEAVWVDLGGAKRASVSGYKGGWVGVRVSVWVGEVAVFFRRWWGRGLGRSAWPDAHMPNRLLCCLHTAASLLWITACTALCTAPAAGRYSVDLREHYEKEGQRLVGPASREGGAVAGGQAGLPCCGAAVVVAPV